MATIWLTYAWADNNHGDVDYLAQELGRFGLTVKLDRWNLSAGRRLWEQIENFIQNPAESDAWAIVASQASLGSQPCQEEIAYALDRALGTRGGAFPVIALFNSPVNAALLPASLRVRLCVSTTDPDWKERIKAVAEGRAAALQRAQLEPYEIRVHPNAPSRELAIEIRPRAGTWSPFLAGIPISEQGDVKPLLFYGPAGQPPAGSVLFHCGSGPSDNGATFCLFASNEATPTQSYYVFVDRLPSRLCFGVKNGQPMYEISLQGAHP